MMKKLLLGTALAAIYVMPVMADDFGARFTGQAPAGLQDEIVDTTGLGIENISPELIEPAAGDYFDSEDQGVEVIDNAEQSPIEAEVNDVQDSPASKEISEPAL